MKITIIFLALLFSHSGFSQSVPKDKKTSNKGFQIRLQKPKDIIARYEYDSVIDMFVYRKTIGGYNLSLPKVLTKAQYYELALKNNIQIYYKTKTNLVFGRAKPSKAEQKNLIPTLYVNSDFFKNIFGGNKIDIIPKGSVDLDLGLRYTKIDNPSISQRLKSNVGLDISPRINVGIRGQIGERLKIESNYNTQSTFNFQNLVKVEYTADEDDIIRKIELGNVSMPINNSLINGAQRLFGAYTEMQFGKTRIKSVFANQQSETKIITAQGGGSLQNFELTPLDYEDNRHFFLAHYFRDNYNKSLENYPFVDTQVQITRIEAWVTNRSQQTQDTRSIVALQDLGESRPENTLLENTALTNFFNITPNQLPDNTSNRYNPTDIGGSSILSQDIRDIATLTTAFGPLSTQVNEGSDYVKLESARKLQENKDFTLHPKLGYISLNQKLNNNEILAVAFQYNYRGKIYQVGEFANTIPSTNKDTNAALVLKLLKSAITKVDEPIWDLMMKNIYSTGAYQIDKEDFKLNIFYTNPSPTNYISPVDNAIWPQGLENRTLINVFNMDRLNAYQNVQSDGDGIFDAIDGITINSRLGVIIFPMVEPFGKSLHSLLGGGTYKNPSTYNANQKKYVYDKLYSDTKIKGQEASDKNRFLIKGKYKNSRGDEFSTGIPLEAFNVPKGSVKVTAGGRLLKEGVDFIVDYLGGSVQIIDPSLSVSNIPIQISLEDSGLFGQQTKTFMGLDMEHSFNKNFKIGATLINLNELPLTQKTNFGSEAVNNTIYGFNGIYSTKLPFLTRWLNKIPTVESEIESNLSVRGELAYLSPDSNKATNLNNQATSYVDDFEGAQTLINIQSPLGWTISSAPKGLGGERPVNDLSYGYKRSKLSWYTIDPIFYTSSRPTDITPEEISKEETRNIAIDEIFPERDVPQGQLKSQVILNLAYYPNAKGPYNNNPNFENTLDKWAGIMRAIQSTNLEQNNIEYIQFWVLDPYYENNLTTDQGELVFNIGNISEDILKDGRKQFENGLPDKSNVSPTINTSWGKVPSTQSFNYTFDSNLENRVLQDVGLDGLNDIEERDVYTNNPPNDPALDNYEYYLSRSGGILDRYYNYNGFQGNTPANSEDNNRGSSGIPDIEDINKDQTMNTIDAYYEFRVPIRSGISVADKYVTDIRVVDVETPDGQEKSSRWIQYKIPITSPDNVVGNISDLRSVTHLRMYVTGFQNQTVLRFGTLNLVRKDWRTYQASLQKNNDPPEDDGTTVDVNAVDIQNNESRMPIPYRLPPEVRRQRINTNNTLIRQNEQSLSFAVCNLESKDARGIFKSVNYDFRRFKFLKMFIHAERYKNNFINDNELVAFIRLGTDYTENYYQAELPLLITSNGATTSEEVWPKENNMNISLELLTKAKLKQIEKGNLSELIFFDENAEEVDEFDTHQTGKLRIAVKGNPSLGNIRSVMIGIKNVTSDKLCGEVWFNELRLADLENKGGWAATGNINLNIADFANISTSTKISTIGFGGLDQKPHERNLEDTKITSFYTTANFGKLLPKKWNLEIPIGYNTSQTLITPKYDKFYDDIKIDDRLVGKTSEQKNQILEQSEDYSTQYSINLLGLKKNRNEGQKSRIYDVENITFNTSYNEFERRSYELKNQEKKDTKTEVIYAYKFKPLEIKPFGTSQSKIINSRYMKWLNSLNVNLLPTDIRFATNITRRFNQKSYRIVKSEVSSDRDLVALPNSQRRNYLFNWQYNINYNLTKSLRFNLTASSNRIVENYYKREGSDRIFDRFGNAIVDSSQEIFDDYFNIGTPNQFNQKLQLTYDVPIDKFPFLNFVRFSYGYTGDFQWKRDSDIFIKLTNEQINTIQNSQENAFNINLNMQRFYKSTGISKILDKGASGILKNFLTLIKRANVIYKINQGTALPGYTKDINFLGTVNPSLGFVFGHQADIREQATKKGWLTTYTRFNELYKTTLSNTFNANINIEPLSGLNIDLKMNRRYSNDYEESFNIQESGSAFNYIKYAGNTRGSFSISTWILPTAFQSSNKQESITFETFKSNRKIIANRLAPQGATSDESGFPSGYKKTNQAVLIPAFVAAYSGQSAESVPTKFFYDIPIPNWNIRYTGLMRLQAFKKVFNRFSLSHNYNASYNINSYRTNLDYDSNDLDKKDINGNIINALVFEGVTLTEHFFPLGKIDFEFKNGFSFLTEVKKSRALHLSLSNNLLTENSLMQYTFGLGYRFKDIKLNVGKERFKGDLNIKTDISLKDDITVIRNLEIQNNQVTAGSNIWSAKFSTDYAVSQNISLILFYDHIFTSFKTSQAFPLTTIRSGITFRYTF